MLSQLDKSNSSIVLKNAAENIPMQNTEADIEAFLGPMLGARQAALRCPLQYASGQVTCHRLQKHMQASQVVTQPQTSLFAFS